MLSILFHQHGTGASQAIEAANEIFELVSDNHADIQNEYFKIE